jgi:enoyl-CoA hydratase/carnithine racemase
MGEVLLGDGHDVHAATLRFARMGALRVEESGSPEVVRLVLERPEKRNALNTEVLAAFEDAVAALAERPAVRVVVLAGDGPSFSAGADLRERAPSEPDVLVRRRSSGRWQRALEAFERLPQVTVARLQGHVIGGAALLAAACDLRVAADDLAFSIPELAIGIPLTWAGLPRLAREIGLPRTREVVLTGRRIGADEALAWGLVHRVAPAGDLDAAVDALVDELLAQPPLALALSVDGLRALGRALSAPDVAWADADLLRWSLRDR